MEDSMRRLSFAIGFLVCALFVVPVAALAQQADGAQDKPARAAARASSVPVNLNTATASQIETLPGIGAKAAQRIIEYRQKSGGFKKIEETIEISRSCPCLLSVSQY
jgi:competence ComEA-like helix-hairpin-helix protein